jgi:hypothetical protein
MLILDYRVGELVKGGELNSKLHPGTGSEALTRGGAYAGRIATGKQPAQSSSKLE